MKSFCTKSILLSSVVLALASSVMAQDHTGQNMGETGGEVTPAATSVATITDAMSLAAWARESQDAEAMLVAARMLASVGTLGEGEEPEATVVDGIEGSATGAAPTSAALFDEAIELAEGDPAITERVSAARSQGSRGLVGGAVSWVRDISARSSVSYRMNPRGGYLWNVTAVGDGDTDVDLFIYDQNGNLVCQDTRVYTRASCSITPAWTGPFTVRISNLGGVWTRTLVMSN